MSEIKVVEKVNEYWKATEESHGKWSQLAQENYNYVYGGDRQWDKEVLELLKTEGRPALTFNRIAPIINLISGQQRSNRQDIKVFPRKGGIQPLAEIFTDLMKWTYDVNNGDYEESFVFMDGLIGQKGWLKLSLDYSEDILNGDVKIERANPLNIREDPASDKYDLSDAQFMFESSWVSKEQLELLFPKKIKELGQVDIQQDDFKGMDVETDHPYTDQPYRKMVDSGKFKYRVKNCWYRSYKKMTLLLDLTTLEVYDYAADPRFKGNAKQVINKMASSGDSRFKIIERVVPRLNLITTIGDLVLQESDKPFGHYKMTKFPLIRFCPYWLNGEIKGVVDDLKDPQVEINKRLSQFLHIMNQSANTGWMNPEGSGVSDDFLEKQGSKTGIVVKYKGQVPPTKIQPTQPSQAHLKQIELADTNMHRISGVNPDLMGQPEQSISGYAMRLRQRQGNTVIEGIYDNFRYTKQLLGAELLDFIRYTDVYSPTEIGAIVEEKRRNIPPELLKSKMVGRYGIKVDLSPNSPTIRMSNFMTLVDLRKNGLPIPNDVLIEAGDFPNKEEIIESLQRQQQVAPLTNKPVKKETQRPPE